MYTAHLLSYKTSNAMLRLQFPKLPNTMSLRCKYVLSIQCTLHLQKISGVFPAFKNSCMLTILCRKLVKLSPDRQPSQWWESGYATCEDCYYNTVNHYLQHYQFLDKFSESNWSAGKRLYIPTLHATVVS